MMFPNLTKKVLLWFPSNSGLTGGTGQTLDQLEDIYQAMGLTVHSPASWSGSLGEYGLIFFPIALSDPSWWGEISGNTWTGRLFITAEHNGFAGGVSSIAYVNGKSGITGITVNSAAEAGGAGTAEADDLTNGVAAVNYSLTTTVSGGTTLSKTPVTLLPWLARNKPSGSLADFVVSGDVDCIVVPSNNNQTFLENLWNVPV